MLFGILQRDVLCRLDGGIFAKPQIHKHQVKYQMQFCFVIQSIATIFKLENLLDKVSLEIQLYLC